MATSGSTDFNLNRDEIIRRSMRILGVIEEGEDPTAEQITNGTTALNIMIKAWEAHGLHLWKQKEGRLFLESGKVSYNLGATGDNASAESVITQIATAASTGAGTIEVDSIAGISNADIIGIVLDGNASIQWTTVNGAPAGTTITLTDVLTGDAAVNQNVFAYTTILERPLRISNIRRRDSSANDVPITQIARQTYMDLSNKSSTGNVVQVYYDPKLDNGILYVWQAPADVSKVINFTFESSIEDFDNIANNPDFPVEWLEAITYNLAVRLASEYGILPQELQMTAQLAQAFLEDVKGWDREPVGITLEPYGDDML